MKTCMLCKELKCEEGFYMRTSPSGRTRLDAKCRACDRKRRTAILAADPEKYRQRKRRSNLRFRYGVTPEEYEELLMGQDGCCAICQVRPSSEEPYLHVDHDHYSPGGEVRGLLCRACNTGIGHMKDEPKLLAEAIRYLAKHRDRERE